MHRSLKFHENNEKYPKMTLCFIIINIYIFIPITLDETSIFAAVHFSMKNINPSCDQARAVGRSDIDVSQ